uniref:Uncharacterized protein n=1 Tax=viral metagenome TaxID=1070528 RepID=A0A6C0ATR3_9ZZZZ|tara:strand:+ start:17212 stop:19155 length:1944 start_codon:yes stop_codon:yes gene_type:complete
MFLCYRKNTFEGFGTGTAGTATVTMDAYDGGVTELLELGTNIFYDPNNGNIIEVVDEMTYEDTGTTTDEVTTYASIYKYDSSGEYSSESTVYTETDFPIPSELKIMTRSGAMYTEMSTTTDDTYEDDTDGTVSFTRVRPIIESNPTLIPTVDGDTASEDLDDSYTSKLYTTAPVDEDAAIQYVIYAAWDQNTYLTVLDSDYEIQNSFTYIGTTLYTTDSGNISNLTDTVASTFTTYVSLDTSNDKSLVSVDEYTDKRKVLQLSEYVFFDFKTADLIVQQSDTNFDILPRSSTGLLESIPSGSVEDMTIYDSASVDDAGTTLPIDCVLDYQGQQLVFYLAHGTATVITVLRKTSATDSALSHSKTYLLDIEGIKGSSPITLTQLISNSETTTTTTASEIAARNEAADIVRAQEAAAAAASAAEDKRTSQLLSAILSARTSMLASGAGGEIGTDGEETSGYGSNYMLKSQVVPPVCPACPACPKAPSKVQCTNCGGQGGSGTLGSSGRSMVQSDGQTRRGDENIINNAVNTTGDLATTTIKTADNLLRDTASGTVDIASGIGSGIMNLLTPEQQAQQQAQQMNGQQMNVQQNQLTNVQRQQYPQGTRTQYNEQQTRKPVSTDFSRNGLLPEKQQTSFMPLTADFSAFGR